MDDDFLTFGDGIADTDGPYVYALFKVTAGDFLKGQKTVSLFAVIDEARLQARFDACDDALVNVGFFLFPAVCLDIDIN